MINVIIPAYNSEKTIKKCLQSIFAQTYQDFKIVVVNDGSTDRTQQILQDLLREFTVDSSQFTVVDQQNQGPQVARNRGFKELHNLSRPPSPGYAPPSPMGRGEGEGKFVLFCDADIVLRSDCLEKMLNALEKNPQASYAYSSFKFGWKTFKLWPFSAERLRKMPYIHTTSLIRAEYFPGFDEKVKRLQDWDLWLTMLEQKKTGVLVPEVLFKIINTKGSMSQWIPAFLHKIPWKWLGIRFQGIERYNEAVARIKEKHKLG